MEIGTRIRAAAASVALGLALAGRLEAQTCTFASGPDVIVGEITGPSNYDTLSGIDALSLGTTSCNIGDQVLNWIAGTPEHPVIGQNLYRLKDRGGWWAMEQVGMSWLKHGFAALQGNNCCSNCSQADGAHLGVGCSDPYSSGLNGSQSGLGPRWQVDAHKGIFVYPPANPAWSGSTARRLQVETADLEPTATTTTQYYGEAQYVTPDDAQAGNNDNNASYRRLSVSGSGSTWSFGFIGITERQQAAIEAWQDSGVDPNVQLHSFDVPGEGHLVLGASATDLGGTWHYEYALYNMNSENAIRAFSIPVGVGASLADVGFHDVVYRDGDGVANVDRDGTDWPATQAGGSITWEVVGHYNLGAGQTNHNALRWGTSYNFRFDTSSPPTSGDLTLTTYRTETVFTVSGVPVPQGGAFGNAFCNGSDGAHAFCPCGNVGNPDAGCDNAAATGGALMEATAFAPDGLGGGTAEFTTTGLNPAASPSYVLLRSTSLNPPAAAFDGVLCLGAVTRVGAGTAVAGTAVEPYVHGAMGSPGLNYYQLWYRSQPAMFCDPLEASNLSNGYDLTW